MKKRILSIALVVVMIVAMIPATLISAAPYTGNTNGYDVYFSGTELALDGQKDAVYENSEKIISTSYNGTTVTFEAYAVATTTGIYVYIDAKGDTSVSVERESGESDIASSDKVQLYTQLSDGTNWVYQYEEYDYGHDTTKQKKDAVKSVITENGYTIEVFKPWADYALSTLTMSNIQFYFGIQINDYVGSTKTGIAYDNRACASYWGAGGSYPNYKGFTYLMTKANFITSPKATTVVNNNYYTANVVDYADITFDGKMDEAYNFTGKITPKYEFAGTIGKDVDFATYILATEKGLYVFASIMDDSLDKKEEVDPRDGDKFQLSFTLGNTYWQRWGYIDFDYVNGGRAIVTPKSSNGFDNTNKSAYTSDKVKQKAVKWEDNKGWNIEIYIPYDFCADTIGAYVGLSGGELSQNDLVFKTNIQVNNVDVLEIGSGGRASSSTTYGQIYDVKEATGSWSSSASHVPVKLAREAGFGQLVYAPSITLDGVKDAAYGDASTAFVFDGRVSTNVTNASCGHALNTSGIAWVTVTDTTVYVYGEFTDTDLGAENQPDGLRMDLAFPMSGAHGYAGLGYAKDNHWTTSYTWESAANRNTYWQLTGAHTDDRTSAKRKDLGDGRYAIEFGLSLPHYEQELMKAGESFPIGIFLTYNDCCTDANGTCHKIYTSNNWNYTNQYRLNMPRWTADKNVTAANATVASKITGAQVSLGENINIVYSANVPVTASNVVMKFTYNDNVTYVAGTSTGLTTYEFLFEDIAPQCMGDNIKAELYVDGKKVDEKAEYSVLENVTNVKTEDNKALVEALLNYGAAAQQYAHYKTDTLVNAGVAAPEYATIVNSDRVVGTANVEGAKFTAAGVYHANANKIYAKVTLESVDALESLTVTINGADAELELFDAENNVYIVYTDDIKVTGFDDVYTFVLSDGTNNQTLTYSVNAYCAAKQNAANANTAALANAMYAYGAAAEAYLAA